MRIVQTIIKERKGLGDQNTVQTLLLFVLGQRGPPRCYLSRSRESCPAGDYGKVPWGSSLGSS